METEKYIKFDFKKKMIALILPLVLFIFTALGYIVYTESQNFLEIEGKQNAQTLADNYAYNIESEFKVYFEKEKAFGDIVSSYKEIDINTRRHYYENLVRQFLVDNPDILAYWLDFDKDSFDGKDDQYKNVGNFVTGRMDVAWHRGTGEIVRELVEDPIAMLEDDFYKLPRGKKMTIITKPYYYSYTNSEDDKIFMTSIASPIFSQDQQVIGVTGIDISLKALVDYVSQVKPYGMGYASMIFQEDGIYLSHRNPDVVGKNVLKNPLFPPKFAEVFLEKITEGERFALDFVGTNNKKYLIFGVPIDLGKTGSKIIVSITIPYESIVAKASYLLDQLLIFFVIAVILTVVGVLLVVLHLSAPINQLAKILADYLDKLAHGNIPEKVDENTFSGNYKTIIHNLNICLSSISLLISDTKDLLYKAIEGNLSARADKSNHQGDYQEIISGINEIINTFTKPLQSASDFMQAVANGDIDSISTINEEYKGDFNIIKNSINATYATIANLNASINLLNVATQAGNLGRRLDTTLFKGDWQNLANGINSIVETFAHLVEDTGRVLNTMATGDLTSRITNHYSGEFGKMKDNINNLGDALIDLISQLQLAIHTTASASSEISSTAELLAVSIQEQSTQIEEVANAMEEMASTVSNNAKSAIKTAQIAQENAVKANDGGKIVDQTIVKMKEIADISRVAAKDINELGESSKKIDEITTVISNIANQTNLLSLNAAIEAARAGESGKGFAVVADSVGKLAAGTAGATKQIADMIKTIQDGTDKAVLVMEKETGEVEKGIELADNAGTSLSNILTSTNELLEMVNQIASASEEQSVTSDNIAKNIAKISQVTVDVTNNIEDVATTVVELARMAENLTAIVSKFKANANAVTSNSHNHNKITGKTEEHKKTDVDNSNTHSAESKHSSERRLVGKKEK